MPKLNKIQIAYRLSKRIAELENGKEIAAKDVRALLTDEQMTRLEGAWQEQEQLRKGKRATTESQQKELGWKSKRELRIEAFKQAVAELEKDEQKSVKDLQQKSEARRSRIYLDTYFAERSDNVPKYQAEGRANNALTRAGLARLDGANVASASPRDKEVWEQEVRLRKQLGIDSDDDDADKE